MKRFFLLFSCALCIMHYALSQERVELIPYGDMEQWAVRYIKESALLGGQTQTLYVLAPTDTIKGNKAFTFENTPRGISNAYAAPAGIDKAACTTQPERRGSGWCARCDTRLITVRALGIVDIRVMIAGTLFLGKVREPVRDAGDPYGAIEMGIPFTKKPKALMLDYKTKVNPEHKLIKAKIFSVKEIEGHDEPEVYVYLQKRWEEDGKIYAKRVGTMRQRFPATVKDWQNNARFDIHYGDISKESWFKPYMDLNPNDGAFKAENSKGKMVKIEEIGWADADEEPTHVVLMLTAGCYPAWYGAPGNAFWIDNVRWVY
jgi:hypothetical protein